VSGVVILVTLSSNNNSNNTDGGMELLASSFAMTFHCSQNSSVFSGRRKLYKSTFVTNDEGRQVVKGPEADAKEYSDNANHFMLISRESGRDFNLWQSNFNIVEPYDYFRVFQIYDDSDKTWFTGKKM